MLGSFFGQEERRKDPEDGQWRTFAELQQACRGKYSEQEIRQYWDTQCAKQGAQGAAGAPAPPSGPAERQMYNVVNDPFMTAGATRRERPNASQNPFETTPSGRLGGGPGPRLPGVQPNGGDGDDFLNSRREQLMDEMDKARRHWTEVAARLMGPGDPERKTTVRNIMVLAPWLLFMWVLLLWVLLRHYSVDSCVVCTALCAIAAAGMILLWSVGKRFGPVSLLPFGILCLVAVCAATVAGSVGWHTYWRQYWWMQTGTRTEGNTAATSAMGLVDSAIIGFWDDGAKRTVNGTYVDNMMSVGYKDEHFYCVAPILSPFTAESTVVRVNFWAVGMDCCQLSGSFFCGDSRMHDAGYGMVMLDDGFPCPDCHEQKFKAAIAKAEGMHNLVSVPGAIMVRWVKNPVATELTMLWKAILFVLLCGILAFCALGSVAWLSWYYGIGKKPLFEGLGLDEGARQKLLA